jgi:putative nucleotidyltransferase with HDIG domain
MRLKPPDGSAATPAPRSAVWIRAYVLVVFLAGMFAIGWSVKALWTEPIGSRWLILAGLTWLSATFSLKVPHVPVTISISETFVFMILLLFGGPAATMAVAVDGLITSLHRRNLQTRRLLFNFTEPAISVSLAAAAYYWISGTPPLAQAPAHLGTLIGPTLVMACVYFLANSGLTALAVAAETGRSAWQLWRGHFLWLSINYFGGASISLLLALNTREVTLSSLMAMVPLLALLYLTFKTWIRRIDDATQHLSQLNHLYLATVESLSMAIDAKDQVTHGHIRRVQKYALELARALGLEEDRDLKALEAAALLHDMGKVAVPDHILNKPGRLTPAEYEKMKLHAVIGADILSAVEFPFPVVPIVRHHHENWDGTGYPDGLQGENIPIGARILSVIDCYDALTSDRPYRRALTKAQALEIINERRGNMYDPAVVDIFVTIVDRLPAIDDSGGPRIEALDRIARMASEPPEREAYAPYVSSASFAEQILQLCDLSEVIGGHASLDDLTHLLSRHLRRMHPASLVVFYMIDYERDVLRAIHWSGTGEDKIPGLELALGDGLSGWVAVNRKSIRNSQPSLDFGDRLASLPTPMRSTLSTALRVGENAIGAVSLYSPDADAFTADHQQILELVAGPIAAAVQRARQFEVQRQSDLTDPETGLPNHRYLTHLLTTHGFSESLLMHSLGVLAVEWEHSLKAPDVLRRLADATRAAIRVTDLMFRQDDQQLVVLIPDCDPETGQMVADRVAASILGALDSEAAAVRVGLACAPIDGDTLTELVQAAQSRLRRQRTAGQVLAVVTRPPNTDDLPGAQRAIPA